MKNIFRKIFFQDKKNLDKKCRKTNFAKKCHFLKNRYFSLLFFDFPFWRNPNFGNFYWFSIDFLLENQVKITKTWSFQKFQFAAVTKWEALFANPPCRLCTSHLGTGLTLTRISIDCLVIEKFKYPQRGSE